MPAAAGHFISTPALHPRQTSWSETNDTNAAMTARLYVMLVLQAAQGRVCALCQTQAADADNLLDVRTRIARMYLGNPSVMFALYNEP